MWPALRLAGVRTPFAKQRQLAPVTREHRQQAVGLAHVAPLEHDGRDTVKTLAAVVFRFHRRLKTAPCAERTSSVRLSLQMLRPERIGQQLGAGQ